MSYSSTLRNQKNHMRQSTATLRIVGITSLLAFDLPLISGIYHLRTSAKQIQRRMFLLSQF